MANAAQKLRSLERQPELADFQYSGAPLRNIAICISTKHKAAALSLSVAKGNGITKNSFAEVDTLVGWEWALI